MTTRFRPFAAIVGLLALTLPSFVSAGAPHFDSGMTLSQNELPYTAAQDAGNPLENHAVYGRLAGEVPIDLYTFTPSEDGDTVISLLGPTGSTGASPSLIFIDPTSATTSNTDLGLELPSSDYHAVVLSQITDESRTYTEPALFTKYRVYVDQAVKLQKDKKYYVFVFDQAGVLSDYALRFGSGKAWGAKDVILHPGAWFRLKTNAYVGQYPFTFPTAATGLLLFLIGLIVMVGIWVVEQVFSFLSNRLKMAGYVLIKMQPFARIFTWVAIWFMLIGGYIHLAKVGTLGVQFVVMLLTFIAVIVQLVYTLTLSRRIGALEVSKQEATIPRRLSAWLYGYFVVSLISFGALVTMLSMYLVK